MQSAVRSSRQPATSDPRSLRVSALKHVTNPRVLVIRARPGGAIPLEYDCLLCGFLLTVNDDLAEKSAVAWPTWACYATAAQNIAVAIGEGVASHAAWPVIDVEAGNPWPVLEAFFRSRRPLASPMVVIADDGMRVAETFSRGRDKGAAYLLTCRDRIIELAADAGLRLVAWAGFHTGGRAARTHFAAVLEQARRARSASARSREIAAAVKVHEARRRRGPKRS